MSRLAINSGEAVLPTGPKISWPMFDERENHALAEVLENGRWCSSGYLFGDPEREYKASQFEKAFAKWVGTSIDRSQTSTTCSSGDNRQPRPYYQNRYWVYGQLQLAGV